mmetsp:Transcript_11035/g.18076  ORF Transcript_11035/g.18076 Transcript_11035/m.18076 type:complete len:98 (+) Transcript_11035:149-442(+)
MHEGCSKHSIGQTGKCKGHGGGKRCQYMRDVSFRWQVVQNKYFVRVTVVGGDVSTKVAKRAQFFLTTCANIMETIWLSCVHTSWGSLASGTTKKHVL